MCLISKLTEFLNDVNFADDPDRGRSQDFVTLRIHEEGSGCLFLGNLINPHREVEFRFSSVEELKNKIESL